MQPYKELAQAFTRIYRFEHLQAIVDWDANVNMPPKGQEARGASLAALAKHIHSMKTDPALTTLLKQLQETDPAVKAAVLSSVELANVREIERAWRRENKLPADLVERMKVVESAAESAWRKCRPANDWNGFVPHLKEIVALAQQSAKLLAEGTDMKPYEALMDIFEPGARLSTMNAVFNDIKSWLPELLQKVLKQQAEAGPIQIPKGPFLRPEQQKLIKKMMETWKFDFEGGRLDVSAHPFCAGVPEDVRITTRFNDDDFECAILGAIHETGHAKYEQNRPRDYITQPVSLARSMGIHESQSLFAEMQMARSDAFVDFLRPQLIDAFGDQPAFDKENLVRFVQRVEPGLIRVDADELTYPLHVLLRFEIEQGLIDGSIPVENVPEEWNKRMKEYLGKDTTGNFKDGPLQDIHWTFGGIGYFPTYTLGAIYAAQLMAACRRDLTDAVVDKALATGELQAILDWQQEKIWQHGSIFETDELVTRATGKPLDVADYRVHLTKRYLKQ